MVDIISEYKIGDTLYKEGRYNGKRLAICRESGVWEDCIGNLTDHELGLIKADLWN
jgi:hypothetical protein